MHWGAFTQFTRAMTRLLLVNVPGPTSFRFLQNVIDELCATYREACQRLHSLEDDVHWDR